MKTDAMFWVGSATFILVLLCLFAVLGISFPLLFYLTVAGQFVLLVMVYRVLTDSYSTGKTFDDFYEDHPHNC